MKFLILLLLSLVPSLTFAKDVQTEQWYTKVGIGYILDQPDDIDLLTTTNEQINYQINYGDYMYIIETGLQINLENSPNYVRFGIGYSDNTSSNSFHSPKKLDVFSEQTWDYDKWFLRLGVGFKLDYDLYAMYEGQKVKTQQSTWLDRITARFSVGFDYKGVEVELGHHSNMFQGKPFNDKFEYHHTSIIVSKVW